jgi:hypothetical protein
LEHKVNPVSTLSPSEKSGMVRPSFAIYDASAGSGKTYACKEYLKIILVAKKK